MFRFFCAVKTLEPRLELSVDLVPFLCLCPPCDPECGSRERERPGKLLSPEPQPMAPQWDEQDEALQPAPGVILHRSVLPLDLANHSAPGWVVFK